MYHYSQVRVDLLFAMCRFIDIYNEQQYFVKSKYLDINVNEHLNALFVLQFGADDQ